MIKHAVAATLLLVACGGDSPQQSTTPTEPSTANAAPATGDQATANTEPAAAPAPAAGDADSKYKESAERVASFSRDFAAVVLQNKDDCETMGSALKKLTADNQDFIQEAKTLDGDPGFRQYLEKNYKAQLEESMKPMVEPLKQCISNPSVQEAIKSLNG